MIDIDGGLSTSLTESWNVDCCIGCERRLLLVFGLLSALLLCSAVIEIYVSFGVLFWSKTMKPRFGFLVGGCPLFPLFLP